MGFSILKSFGVKRDAGLSHDGHLIATKGFVAGGDGKPAIVLPAPDIVAFFDDFLTDASGFGMSDTGLHTMTINDTGIAGQFFYSKTGDTGIKGGLVAGTNGVYRITSSETVGTATADASSRGIVGKQLAWKANQGPGPQSGRLRMSARVKMSAYPTASSGDLAGMFVGFTDSGGHELPAYDTGRTGDSGASAVVVASDLVGFLWGSRGDTGFRGISNTSGSGGTNDSGAQQVTLTTTAPTDNKWVTLEVEIHRGISDTGGTATFYIDGQPKGSISSPINLANALTPCVYFNDTGGAVNFDIDWINVSAPRDTGL